MPDNEAQMHMPDEYLKEIGRIVVCWNSLERMLDAALIVALSGKNQDPDGRASAILAHMAFPQRINALESMLRLIDKTPNGMVDIFNDTVRPLLNQSQEKRNGIVHHFWTGHNGVVHRSNVQARGKLKFVLAKVSIEELIEVSELISSGRTALQKFCLARLIPVMSSYGKGSS
jgi:hypothetical protein